MEQKNKYIILIVTLIFFLMLNIILINKNNTLNIEVNNYTYLDGCMNMLALEYNHSLFIYLDNTTKLVPYGEAFYGNKTLNKKYMECAELR